MLRARSETPPPVDDILYGPDSLVWDWQDGDLGDEQREHAPTSAPDVERVDQDMWWPWPNRKTCLMDVMGAFPRALFSESELTAARWLAGRMGSIHLPSIRKIKLTREAVLRVAGVNPRLFKGKCGHLYAVNDLSTIIAHDFANPLVREQVSTYAEDSGNRLDHPGEARTKEATLDTLHTQWKAALRGAPSSVDKLATETGTKDKYLQHFVDILQSKLSMRCEEQMESSTTSAMKTRELEGKIERLRAEWPDNVFNPFLQLPELDMHCDSPVEILHVVLLGVVKYFWRDACSRQTHEGKRILKTRLSSVNVDGLGISPLRGHTLVYYAGSLVGRDFRGVLQVAPAVLRGLIPDAAYEAWLSLARMAPLIFQPDIQDLARYKTQLSEAITDFLAATALWTTQWFNKPKFHLFVHLLQHILRFGPASIYATEVFESYNYVIRLRSINSNKRAPSLDIAHSCSHLHVVRHLISGGYVTCDTSGKMISPRQAGDGVLALLDDKEVLDFMCMRDIARSPGSSAGQCTPITAKTNDGPTALRPREDTMTAASGVPISLLPSTVSVSQSVILQNTDLAKCGSVVAIQRKENLTERLPNGVPEIASVDEIIADPDTHMLVGALVTKCVVGPQKLPYQMPLCRLVEDSPEASSERFFVTISELLACLNTYHDCQAHACAISRTRTVIQERERTSEFDEEIVHACCPEDRILNMAQLCSAEVLSPFRERVPRYPGRTISDVIPDAMRIREQLRQEAERKKQDAQNKKARQSRKNATPVASSTPMIGQPGLTEHSGTPLVDSTPWGKDPPPLEAEGDISPQHVIGHPCHPPPVPASQSTPPVFSRTTSPSRYTC
ncbi:hypothetical protein C8Q80DRAFT_1357527 [Daedaleopsis nitida]|nr:hypothetical protein C8Q80DRAFT_1357527 [Daedaleopsis nitida]